ncbi:MAG: hypothetical protein DRP30_04875 [Thermotoga sp.]|nr:MAG: hypothetical protein DRP30_04875 [Thermotoga sp.]HDM70682.1 hypothetical protein [Thermotogales bacterium]
MNRIYLDFEVNGEIPKHAILVGDRARIDLFKEAADDSEVFFEKREFVLAKMKYHNRNILIISTGMGAPSTAIVIEELANLGVQKILRAGTMLVFDEENLGKIIIPIGAMRGDGLTINYVEQSYPAVPDTSFLKVIFSLQNENIIFGIIKSSDSFYTDFSSGNLIDVDFLKYKQSFLKRIGILGMDMETSTVLILSRLLGLKSGVLCASTISSDKRLDPNNRYKLEKKLVELSLKVVKLWR